MDARSIWKWEICQLYPTIHLQYGLEVCTTSHSDSHDSSYSSFPPDWLLLVFPGIRDLRLEEIVGLVEDSSRVEHCRWMWRSFYRFLGGRYKPKIMGTRNGHFLEMSAWQRSRNHNTCCRAASWHFARALCSWKAFHNSSYVALLQRMCLVDRQRISASVVQGCFRHNMMNKHRKEMTNLLCSFTIWKRSRP